ncbi:hypothetical protein Lalb_Chr06g0168831 [Lupinus albus]|uniref:Uncharacterized protein n=1 Tax=Lupinus albus TaxID=3870 RepID=A0A6A4QDM3_LUPAL|nr:hypothetical protein Lalb_Chr06g0168831 [Lupinus albus]
MSLQQQKKVTAAVICIQSAKFNAPTNPTVKIDTNGGLVPEAPE